MFEFFNFARKRKLSFDQLQTMQTVAQMVVLSLEGSVKIPGAAKKTMALEIAGELLKKLDIVAPDSLIDTSIEASVQVLKALDGPQGLQAKPAAAEPLKARLDVSGRPATGNSEKGLSL
jgi:hypothetical protein